MNLSETEFMRYIKRFDTSSFRIIIGSREHAVGENPPEFTVKINNPPKISDLLACTSLTLGEAYMDGDIEIEGDLYEALCHFLSQINKFSSDSKKIRKIIFTKPTVRNQRKEISAHYDIGNDFYRLWLDESMSYSCGIFENENDSLYTAQKNKVHHIIEKLELRDGMSLLDIGCGWGFLLTEAAKMYNITGVGITLSLEQKKFFEEEIKANGLENRLEVRLIDYRELPSLNTEFDCIVSVGMLEHVGRKNYRLFMECVKKVLKNGGLFLLHYISSLRESPGDAWIKKYIFPGGMIPSLREIINIAGDIDFYTIDVESLRRHYTKTLLDWNTNFQRHRSEIEEMFDKKFARMWELYLCSCAAVFSNGIADLHQILFTNGVNNNLPMLRRH